MFRILIHNKSLYTLNLLVFYMGEDTLDKLVELGGKIACIALIGIGSIVAATRNIEPEYSKSPYSILREDKRFRLELGNDYDCSEIKSLQYPKKIKIYKSENAK